MSSTHSCSIPERSAAPCSRRRATARPSSLDHVPGAHDHRSDRTRRKAPDPSPPPRTAQTTRGDSPAATREGSAASTTPAHDHTTRSFGACLDCLTTPDSTTPLRNGLAGMRKSATGTRGPCTAEEPRPGVPCADAPCLQRLLKRRCVSTKSGLIGRLQAIRQRSSRRSEAGFFLRASDLHSVVAVSPSSGAVVRLTLCFALEALDWVMRKEFSDLCLGRSTHPLAQSSEGPV